MKIKLTNQGQMPTYAEPQAAGMDLRANIDMVIHPRQTKLIPTGLYVCIPEGC